MKAKKASRAIGNARSARRLADEPTGIRIGVDQRNKIDAFVALNPETKLSNIIRLGIDLFFAQQEGRIQVMVPQQGQTMLSVQSISAGLARGSKNTSP